MMMMNTEYPFAEICRTVLTEKYSGQEQACIDDSLPAVKDMPEDVIDEALKRYYAGKRLVISPRMQLHAAGVLAKKRMKRTITYV